MPLELALVGTCICVQKLRVDSILLSIGMYIARQVHSAGLQPHELLGVQRSHSSTAGARIVHQKVVSIAYKP